MLFKQRKKDTWTEKIWLHLWPRYSFSRSFRYFIKRLLRISASPHSISLGLAIGVFFAFSPFFGAHILLACLFAWLFAANIGAAILGTAVANPITLPLVLGASYKLGHYLSSDGGRASATQIAFGHMRFSKMISLLKTINLKEIWHPTLKYIFVGSFVLGSILSITTYFFASYFVKKFRESRSQRVLRIKKIKTKNLSKSKKYQK